MDKEKMFTFSFGCGRDILPAGIVLSPYIPLKKITGKYDVRHAFKGRLYSGAVCSANGSEFAFIRCGVGDRLFGDAVLLLEGTRVENMVFVGSCGSLAECGIGDYIVASGAVNGEGFSRYHEEGRDTKKLFSEPPYPADAELTGKPAEYVNENKNKKRKARTGKVFTVGSVMAEEEPFLSELRESGAVAVEMELSAFYKAAGIAGKKAAALLVVSDLPLEKPLWENVSKEEKCWYNTGEEQAVSLAVDFITGTER